MFHVEQIVISVYKTYYYKQSNKMDMFHVEQNV